LPCPRLFESRFSPLNPFPYLGKDPRSFLFRPTRDFFQSIPWDAFFPLGLPCFPLLLSLFSPPPLFFFPLFTLICLLFPYVPLSPLGVFCLIHLSPTYSPPLCQVGVPLHFPRAEFWMSCIYCRCVFRFSLFYFFSHCPSHRPLLLLFGLLHCLAFFFCVNSLQTFYSWSFPSWLLSHYMYRIL